MQLTDALKGYTYDQDKLFTPEETVRRVRDRLGSLDLQLLQETMRIDSGRLDIPVYLSLLGVDARRVVPTHKQMGKGATPVQAEASALMELVERFSFFAYIEAGPLDLGTPRDFQGQALPFSYLARSLFDDGPEAAAAARLYDGWPMYFVPATNLTRGEAVMLPIHWFYLIEEYNGPAAGNCLEEAILQGLGEVVERHVGSIISHDRLSTPVIDPDSVTDPVARELLEKFKKNGIVLHLRDFSLDTGIPTVAALAYDPSTFPQDSEIVFAAGTTTDPTKSLVRALTEVAQLAGDFNRRTSYRPTLPKYETLEDAAYLMAPGPIVPLDSLPNLSRPNLKDEIQLCLAALSRLDLEVLVVNTTHPASTSPRSMCWSPAPISWTAPATPRSSFTWPRWRPYTPRPLWPWRPWPSLMPPSPTASTSIFSWVWPWKTRTAPPKPWRTSARPWNLTRRPTKSPVFTCTWAPARKI